MIHRSYYAGEVQRVTVDPTFHDRIVRRSRRLSIDYNSDRLRERVCRLAGKEDWSYGHIWDISNVGISCKQWGGFMSGCRLPEKYHDALDTFLAEHGV
jgi:hypothetical protein